MPRKVLVTPVGFLADLVIEPMLALGPDIVHIIRTQDDRSKTAAEQVRNVASANGIMSKTIRVTSPFDFVAWWRAAQEAAASHEGAEIYYNLAAGAGVHASMLCMVAAEKGHSCIAWDADKQHLEFSSPGIILALADLQDTDRRVLETLSIRPESSGDVATKIGMKPSTTSAALKRLTQQGFLTADAVGRQRVYSLRMGVAKFLPSILGPRK